MKGIVLKELAGWMNKAGFILGDPMTAPDLVEMKEGYCEIVGQLNRDGCNFILIMAKLVEASLEELDELHKERDARGVN